MSTIKNIHLLDLVLSEKDKEKLEAGATLHKRMANITFKILEVSDSAIVVRVAQGKHMSENYADKKTLVTRTRELFGKFLPHTKINPQAITYVPHPVTDVEPEWIRKQMDRQGIKLMDIVNATGIDKTNVSAWVNGVRPMSQPVKALFYYFFISRVVVNQEIDLEALKKAGIKVDVSSWGMAA